MFQNHQCPLEWRAGPPLFLALFLNDMYFADTQEILWEGGPEVRDPDIFEISLSWWICTEPQHVACRMCVSVEAYAEQFQRIFWVRL